MLHNTKGHSNDADYIEFGQAVTIAISEFNETTIWILIEQDHIALQLAWRTKSNRNIILQILLCRSSIHSTNWTYVQVNGWIVM